MEGSRETEVFPLLFNDPRGSSVTEGPSKRGKISGHLVNISEKKFQGNGGGQRAAAMLLTLCLLFSLPSVDASSYRGVSKHKSSKFFHCETEYFGSIPRKKIYFGKFETEKMAASACDVAFFYTGMPFAKFNFKWSREVILNFCKQRSFYTDLTNWDDRRRFIEAEANFLVSFVPDFHWEDIILVPTPVPTTMPITPRQRSEWIAGRIVHHFRNQPWRVQEFMAWFMEPSTERRILEVHAQKSSSATHDTILGAPEVDLVWPMNRNDIIMGVESLEARPGRNLWLLIIFGGALPFIFELFESKRAGGEYGGVDDAHVGDTALTGGDSCRSSARIVKKLKCHHSACDDLCLYNSTFDEDSPKDMELTLSPKSHVRMNTEDDEHLQKKQRQEAIMDQYLAMQSAFMEPEDSDEEDESSFNPFMFHLRKRTNPEPPYAGSDPVLQNTATGGSVPPSNEASDPLPLSNEASDPLPPSNEATDPLPPNGDSDLVQPTVGGLRSWWSLFGF